MATSMKRRGGSRAKKFSATLPDNGNFSHGDPNSKQAKKFNLELGNAQTKQQGLKNLQRLLASYDENVLSENIALWLKTLSQTIIQDSDHLAAENFKVALSQACQVPSISREISTNLIPSILTNFLQGKNRSCAVITGIEAILTSYPTSCGSLRSQIVKVMLPLMMSSLDEKQAGALRCWVMVPFLGGGGPKRSTHSQQWQEQMDQTIKALNYAFQKYIGEEDDNRRSSSTKSLDPAIGSLSLPFLELPSTEPELSHALVRRVCVACECLRSLLDVDFPISVPIPINMLITTLLDILDMTPPQMGNTSEMLLRATFLHEVHSRALKVLGKLTNICKRSLCCYSTKINRSFSALLDLWKDKAPIFGKDKKHSAIRTQIYTTVANWLQNCGATTRFLCGPTHLNQSLLKHLVDDIKPVKNVMQVSNTKLQSSGGNKKAKKRRYAEATQEMLNGATTDKIRNPKANAELTIAALKVILRSVNIMEHRLSPNIHQIFQETVIMLLLQIQQGHTIIPYTNCSRSHLLLYKALLSLTLSPLPSLAPPTALCTRIFAFAISRERNPEIRSYCQEGISALNNVVHPWRNAWHTCGVETKPTTQVTSILPPDIEPMNLDDNSAQMEDSDVNGINDEDKQISVHEDHQPVAENDTDLNGCDEEAESTDDESDSSPVDQAPSSPESSTSPDGDSPSHIPTQESLEIESRAEIGSSETADIEIEGGEIEQDNIKPVSTSGGESETEENLEEVNQMILDFVDASPERGNDLE